MPYVIGQLGSLYFCFLLFASLSLHSLSSSSSFYSLFLSCVLYSLFMALELVVLMAAHFLFCLRQIACCCSLGIPCLCVILKNSQGVATFPPTNCVSFSSLVQFFGYIGKWLVPHLSSQIRPQILIHRGWIPCQIWLPHQVWSRPFDMEPPDQTPFVHFM